MNLFKVTLDTIHQNGVIGPITQFDHATLELQILSGGQVGEAWGNPRFELIAMKRDMNSVREVDQDKFTILSKEDHKVQIELKEQFLTCRGSVKMQLVIKDGSRTSTTIFRLSIAQSLDATIIESLKDIKVLEDLDEVVESLSTFEVAASANEEKRQENERLREVAESNRQEEFNQAQLQRDTEFNNKLEEFQEQVSGLEGIQGKPGETPQIRVNETHIQLKYPSQQEWTDLVALESLKGPEGPIGPPGIQGKTGEPGKDGANGEDGQDGMTPNFTIGTVTTLEPGQGATVTIRGTKENPILDIAIPRGPNGKDGEGGGDRGERLVVNYTHSGNKEIYFSEIDYTTGIATTTEPHRITAKTEIMIVPNNWTLDATTNENMSVPIEWTIHNTRITVTPVDENKLLVANNAGNAIIPVNLNDVSNRKVDCTKFHFEIPVGWKFTNIPGEILHFRLLAKGYIKGCGQYRYVNWGIEYDDKQVRSPACLNPLGIPSIPNAQSTHCIFGIEGWIVDARDYSIIFQRDSLFYGRRKGYSQLVWDSTRESTKHAIPSAQQAVVGRHRPIRLDYIGAYSNHYAYLSNGTSIKLYDLGGNDNEK